MLHLHKHVFIFLHILAPQIGRLVVCEGKKSILRCPSNKVLKISRATYGRTDRTTCPHSSIRTTKCSTNKPLPIITRQCEGRQTCTVASPIPYMEIHVYTRTNI